jgi:hypothetical protein
MHPHLFAAGNNVANPDLRHGRRDRHDDLVDAPLMEEVNSRYYRLVRIKAEMAA